MPPKLAVPPPKKAPSVSRSESSESFTSSGSEASSGANSKLDELSLTKDQLDLLKNAFTAFDHEKKGCIGIDMIGTILELLGHAQTQAQLEAIIKEVDVDGSGELEFDEFCILASKFLTEEAEDENTELLTSELKEAFRFYDREGNGYITTEDFKEILRELDPDIPEKELVGMVNEIDIDDSGTVDFEVLKNAFHAFDAEKKGCIGIDMIGTILELLGHAQTQTQLEEIIKEVDVDGSGELEFEEFCILASKFLTEEEEGGGEEMLSSELKEAFRFYDKEENGYITTEDLEEILRELDPDLTAREIAGIVGEIDVDGSGTVDFEEFVKALR